ncbi:hypothetical protein [Streptacidiphilus rugosus]|uniref:hypothetical protein n=1 Tax=Streptacidiphilus rugosus TaxID=405783 RepID=UPI00056AA61A|nr:hypothetical protein [Streptacidiphilus rugosus]
MNRPLAAATTVALAAVLAGCATTSSSSPQPEKTITVGSIESAMALPATPTAAASSTAMSSTAWSKVNGDLIGTLQADISSVSTDQHDSSSLPTDCLALDTDWQNAQSAPPIPNAAAQKTWSAALAALHTGWWNCNGGFSDNKPSEVSAAVASIQSAAPLLAETKRYLAAAE